MSYQVFHGVPMKLVIMLLVRRTLTTMKIVTFIITQRFVKLYFN